MFDDDTKGILFSFSPATSTSGSFEATTTTQRKTFVQIANGEVKAQRHELLSPICRGWAKKPQVDFGLSSPHRNCYQDTMVINGKSDIGSKVNGGPWLICC